MSRENYLKSREALIAEEASYRFDRSSASAATALELRANELLSALRIPPKESNFLMAREAIEESKLFSVLRTCPKGALLHGHLDAMAPTAFLLRAALEHQELLWVKADRTVTEDDIQDRHAEKPVVVHFEWRPTSTPSATHQGVGLTDANYDASWIPVSQARANFKGGESVFDGFILTCLSLPSQKLPSHHTWEHFTAYFLLANNLLTFQPVFQAYVEEVIRVAIEDNISWLELRMNFFRGQSMCDASGRVVGHSEQLDIINHAVTQAKQVHPEFWGLKIIYSTLRFINGSSTPCLEGFESSPPLRYYMEECLELKQAHSNLISGFDLVGQEDHGISLLSYLDDLLWFKNRQTELNIDIPLVLHAGETAKEGSDADLNLYDAILLGARRIGHGFALAHHPRLMQLCKERQIVVESCPISNQLLGYASSMETHPLAILLKNGVPCALSSDDPAVFTNHGLTHDLYQFYAHTRSFDLFSIKCLLQGSIEGSLIDNKPDRVREWQAKWTAWVRAVVDELQ